MGRNIGRILRRLEERGWQEDKLVVFTTDQGWNAGHHGVGARGGGLAVHDDLEPPSTQLRSGDSDGSIQVGPADQGVAQ